jgi:hypothetical protein
VPLARTIAAAVIAPGFAVAGLWWSLAHTRPSIAFAFFVNLGLMGFAFAVALVLPLRLWPAYYCTFAFEQGGRLYDRVGVRWFQRGLRLAHVHGPSPFPRLAPSGGGLARNAALRSM